MLQWEHSAVLSTFITLPFVTKIFVLSIFEWPLKTGFTVCVYSKVFSVCRILVPSMVMRLDYTCDMILRVYIGST